MNNNIYPKAEPAIKFVAVLALIGGCMVLGGWMYNTIVLRDIIPREISVEPNTAIGFILCGIALLLLLRRRSIFTLLLLTAVCIPVLLLGGLTLFEYFTGVSTGLDDIYKPFINPAIVNLPLRMALGCALCFILLPIAFVCIYSNISFLQKAGQVLLHVVTLVSLLAIMGYLYRIPTLYKLTTFTPMAFRSSISFFGISIVASLIQPSFGITGLLTGSSIGSVMARRMFPLTLAAMFFIGFFRVESMRFQWTTDQVGVIFVFVASLSVALFIIVNTAGMLNVIDRQRLTAKEEVDNLNKNLENKVRERTLELNDSLDALKVSEEKFRLLVESARDYAIFLIDTAGRIKTWSAGAQSIYGYAPAEILGHNFEEFYTADELKRGEPARDIECAIKTGRFEFEGWRMRKDGSEFWANTVTTALYDRDGNFSGAVKVTRNITERKQTEERLELALDGMVAGFWEWDIVNDKTWWSPRFFSLLGFENNEIKPPLRGGLLEWIHPDNQKLTFDTIKSLLHQRERAEIEVRCKTKPGAYKWFQVTGQTKFDEHGRAVKMVGSIVDVDEKKKHLEIIDSQASLIQMMPDAIVYHLADNTLVRLNEGGEKMFGVQAGEAIGRNVDDVITSRVVGSTRETVVNEISEKGYWRGESEITVSGKKIRALTYAQGVKDIDGKGPGWITIYSDISLLRINAELKMAMQRLEVNNQYLEQLAYISAHDIKSPILTLTGLIEILDSEKGVKDEYAQMLTMITGTIRQMQRTNNSLNNILKLRKNLLNADMDADQVYPLQAIVEDIKSTLRPEIDATNASIEWDMQSVSQVHFPYIHLKSVLYNLLSNSIKYRDTQRPLTVKLGARQLDKHSFEFYVEDNGIGIDTIRHKDKLFGIFKRFHDHVEGSGVGLHMVKSIVEAYGGTVDVKSEPGKGSRFTIIWNNLILAG